MDGGDNWFANNRYMYQEDQLFNLLVWGSPQTMQRGSLAYLLMLKYWQMASLSLLSITNTPFKVLR